MSLAFAPIALAVGLLIGAVGVGGIGLPPALTWLLGIDPHTAAGTSSWSFLFTGIMGTVMYGRHEAMPWRMAGWLIVGTCPAALLGSVVNSYLPDGIALLPLGVFTLAAGLYHLFLGSRTRGRRERLGTIASVLVGAAVGFCSALTGTGGPVFLIPVLLALGVPAVTAIAAGQVIQLPLVVFAVSGYAAQGSIDFELGTAIGLIAAVGVVFGALLALRMRQEALRTVTSFALVGFGLLVSVTELI